MRDYKLIICPTDLSPEADEALGYAADLAVANQAKLLVVYWRADDSAGSSAGLFEESIALNVGPEVARLAWEGKVVTGRTAAEAIAKVAADRHADLIVMRSRRRPIGAAIMGSTAETVSRIAPCPVLVTHPSGNTHESGPGPMRKILVAYDFWDDSEIALQQALSAAAESNAEVHLLHVISASEAEAPEIGWNHLGAEHQMRRVEQRLRGAAPQASAMGVRVVPHVAVGHPYREILAYAETNDIDLICMGARGRDFGARSLFGSNSDRVLRQAECPVLVTRPLRPAYRPEGAQTPVLAKIS